MKLLRIANGAAALLVATTALAQTSEAPSEEECIAAFDHAQDLRKNNALRAAADQLKTCADAACPSFVAEKCAPWLSEVEAELPTVVIAASDADGTAVLDVRVTAGDELIADKLSVDAIALDPGEHVLRFEREGSPPVERTVVVRSGEKNTRVEVRFEPPPVPAPTATALPPPVEPAPPPAPPPALPTPDSADDNSTGITLAIVGFSLAGAGLVVGAIAGGVAVGAKSDLDDTCATPPGCTQEDIDSARLPAHVATAGFIAAGVGAALGAVGLLLVPSGEEGMALRLAPGGAWLVAAF